MTRYLILLACALHCAAPAAWTTLEDWADIIAVQQRKRQPLPVLSQYGAGLDLADAYHVQRLAVEALDGHGDLAGYALGLTRPWTQQRFGLSAPVSCLLPGAQRIARGTPIPLGQHRRAMLGYGLGFVAARAQRIPLANAAEARALVAAVVPLVVLFDYGFEPAAALRGEDYIALNCALAGYLSGKPLPSADPALVNGVFVELERDGEVIDRGKATNVLGEQYAALLWLVNKVIGQGHAIEQGALLATGPLGDVVPAAPGRYAARFRDLDDLRFELAPAGPAQARPPTAYNATTETR